ncbi:MAG TPA: hypothetical protein VLL54_10850 [Pyrinomonadaceae bacterium]|nr:hypothetical protein [Pyrinomonadaceae bacterium]
MSLQVIAAELRRAGKRVDQHDRLIEVKRAAGRPKDFEAIAELQALIEESEK